jgi:KDO2-lipid IV(A) lauroyltransferase
MKRRLEYWSVLALSACVRVVPEPLVRAAGTLLGRIFYAFDRPHRRVAERNLAAAFPSRPQRERSAIARGAFEHFGRLGFEILKFATLSNDAMRARVEFDGLERLRAAYARGKGVLLYTGHFGYWEIHALAQALEVRPMAVLARALDNPDLNALLERIRRRTGNTVIYRQGTIRRVLRTLQEGQAVAILIDQHVVRDAVMVDFFDRPAATTPLVAALALRTGAPVIPCFALPLGGGRFRLIYEHPIEPPPGADKLAGEERTSAVREFTQRCTDVLEMYVRRHPDLWLWMHRRWREEENRGVDQLGN